MSRSLSDAFKAAAFAAETGRVPVILVTVTHSSLATPLRFSSDPTVRLDGTGAGQPAYGTISRGEEFTYTPFSLILPDDQDRAVPAARLRMANIHQDLVPLIRSISEPAQFLIEIVLDDALDTVEVAFPILDLAEADYDAGDINLDLTIDNLASEPFPAHSFDPSGFSGLFG